MLKFTAKKHSKVGFKGDFDFEELSLQPWPAQFKF